MLCYCLYSIDYGESIPTDQVFSIIGVYKTKENAEKGIIKNIFEIYIDFEDYDFNLIKEHLKTFKKNNNLDINAYYKKYSLKEIYEFWEIDKYNIEYNIEEFEMI